MNNSPYANTSLECNIPRRRNIASCQGAVILMALTMRGLQSILPAEISTGWELVILVPVGSITYLLYSFLVNQAQLHEVYTILWTESKL